MTRVILLWLSLLSAASPTAAGPNVGGTLVLHDTGLLYSVGQWDYPCPIPTCAEVDDSVPAGDVRPEASVWKVYAVFPEGSQPRLKAFVMGAPVSSGVRIIAWGLPDSTSSSEVPHGGWPNGDGVDPPGTAITFDVVRTGQVIECYWFAGFPTGSAPATWRLAPYPYRGTIFVDDATPPHEDVIAGLGTFGFGRPGDTPCPDGTPVGACCYGWGHCQVATADECRDSICGIWSGPNVPCGVEECSSGGGACCVPEGGCEILPIGRCYGIGGVYRLGCCEPDPCVQTTACCHGTTCTLESYSGCLKTRGSTLGFEACEPNPCVVPTIETSWGRIKQIYR